jgi:hypothetical protein
MDGMRLPGRLLMLLAVGLALSGRVEAMDHLTVLRDGRQTEVQGRILTTAQDGGLLILAQDGVLWRVEPQEVAKQSSDAAPFKPLAKDEIAEQLLRTLPPGFKVHQTAHYVVLHNTSPVYAQWCGGLFERLYAAFNNYWKLKDFNLAEPEFPLVAIVFADEQSYLKYCGPDLGAAGKSIIGYFNLQTNRMAMYDLSGMQALGGGHERGGSAIRKVLSHPDAERLVATIVHEATHQIAFNCGLQTRLSDCPYWFSEGLAVYFETPDLSSASGWRNMGGVNRPRAAQFGQYLRRRPADSLLTLVSNDKRFRDTSLALDAYSEAWALTYYLVHRCTKQYVAYLRMLSKKKPLIWDSEATRLAEFQEAFGDLKKLDAAFLHFMATDPPVLRASRSAHK